MDDGASVAAEQENVSGCWDRANLTNAHVHIIDAIGLQPPLPAQFAESLRLISEQSNIALSFQQSEGPNDASTVSFENWRSIATHISRQYDSSDGFVIWHGTETLAFAASALSFMFENLGKPVVVTGANQLPDSRGNHQARLNLISAILVAANRRVAIPLIPEVVVCFGDQLLRGCRTSHASPGSFRAFDSPYCPVLGTIGERISVDQDVVRPVSSGKSFALNNLVGESIAVLRIYPGIDSEPLDQLLQTDMKGLILEFYGMGTASPTLEFQQSLKRAIDGGIVVVPISIGPRSARGVGSSLHASRPQLQEIDFASGTDMTLEAAFAKLSLTIGRGLDPSSTRTLWEYDLRGEQSHSKGSVENLWLPKHDLVVASQLISEVNQEVMSYLARHPKRMHDLTPRAFELLIAEILRHHGYAVELTPETRDGGYDLRALYVDGLGISFLSLVEAKRYEPNNPVGVSVVRNLYGVVSSENAARGIVVTTSRFTRDAKNFQEANLNRLSLHDYEDICNWLGKTVG
jgi:L-asparaginase